MQLQVVVVVVGVCAHLWVCKFPAKLCARQEPKPRARCIQRCTADTIWTQSAAAAAVQ